MQPALHHFVSRRAPMTSSISVADDGRSHHRNMLMASVAMLLLALVLHETENGRVAVRGLPNLPLPHSCMSRQLFGVECPGCGLTRSVIHLA